MSSQEFDECRTILYVAAELLDTLVGSFDLVTVPPLLLYRQPNSPKSFIVLNILGPNLFSEIPYILKSLSKKRAYGFLHTLPYHLTHLFISRP